MTYDAVVCDCFCYLLNLLLLHYFVANSVLENLALIFQVEIINKSTYIKVWKV